jgi:hypothetical protein
VPDTKGGILQQRSTRNPVRLPGISQTRVFGIRYNLTLLQHRNSQVQPHAESIRLKRLLQQPLAHQPRKNVRYRISICSPVLFSSNLINEDHLTNLDMTSVYFVEMQALKDRFYRSKGEIKHVRQAGKFFKERFF